MIVELAALVGRGAGLDRGLVGLLLIVVMWLVLGYISHQRHRRRP